MTPDKQYLVNADREVIAVQLSVDEYDRLTAENSRYAEAITLDWIGAEDQWGDRLICRYCNATVHRQWKPKMKDECTHKDDCVYLLATDSGSQSS